jgi:Putative metal-binding motif
VNQNAAQAHINHGDFSPVEFFEDADDDGFGNANESVKDCTAPEGFVDNSDDCNDEDLTVNPDAEEIPDDGVDNDCNPDTPDEQPGKIIFITSQTFNGNLGGLAGADAKCQQLADAAGLGGTFKAWLSDSTTDARDRLDHATVPYRLVDGPTVADDFTDLTDGSLDAPINRTENGTVVNGRPWTGTDSAGEACFQASGGTCNLTAPTGGTIPRLACEDWTTTEGIGEAVTGSIATSTAWTSEGDRRCTDNQRLYCIQQ